MIHSKVMKCKNCGAELINKKCDYCGSISEELSIKEIELKQKIDELNKRKMELNIEMALSNIKYNSPECLYRSF